MNNIRSPLSLETPHTQIYPTIYFNMRSGLSFKALVPVVALLLTSSAFGQEEIAPNANDIAMGADPSEPLIAIPAAWIPAGISVKRSEVTANDKHLLTKRHYGVFE